MIQDNPPHPKLFRLLIHGKAAGVAFLIAEKEKIPPLAALRKFYLSDVYKDLETENTKTWWESPAQLYCDYEELPAQ